MLKDVARYTIRAFAKRAPWGVREALVEGICEQPGGDRKLLAQLARKAHISAFLAEGECGLIQSSSADETIIPFYASNGTWAASTIAFFRKVLADCVGTYIDVGANIGLTTIPIAQNPSVHCVAFEPDPTNFGHLIQNVRRNCHYGNVELMHMAVMDRSGSISLGLDRDGNPGNHRVIRGHTTRNTISVPAVTLDEYFAEGEGPVSVKIDTQGAEPFVVAGGWKTLSRANAIVMEFWPYGMAQLGGSPDAIYTLLRQFHAIALARGEDGNIVELNDSDQVISVLSRRFDEAKETRAYWDIYLTR